jgi:hypothetical protein
MYSVNAGGCWSIRLGCLRKFWWNKRVDKVFVNFTAHPGSFGNWGVQIGGFR